MLTQWISHLAKKPRQVFLIDSLGAMFSALGLLIILNFLNGYVRLTPKTLRVFLLLAGAFCLYSAACFLFIRKNHRFFILIIGIANLFYCFLITGTIILHFDGLNLLSLAYFVSEVVIIAGLVCIEINVVILIKRKRTNISD